MKAFAHEYKHRHAPLVHISQAVARQTYFGIGRLEAMKAILNVVNPHYAFIGKPKRQHLGAVTISSGGGGKGIVHELYQAELAALDRIRFRLYGYRFDFGIRHCEVECSISVDRQPRTRVVCDNLLWLESPCAPFAPLNLLNVEIWDTHRVPDPKKKFLRQALVPTIEIRTQTHIPSVNHLTPPAVVTLRRNIRQHLLSGDRVEPTAIPYPVKGFDVIPDDLNEGWATMPMRHDPWFDALARDGGNA